MKRIMSIGALAGLIVTGGLLVGPAASAATQGTHVAAAVPFAVAETATMASAKGSPLAAAPGFFTEKTPDSCTISSGSLNWGVKESFRSYISSSIAKGGWEVSEGATYETPLFGWTNASGQFNPEDASGNVSFLGTITFTGHGGILNMVIANPTIEFASDGTARLRADVRSNDTSGALTLDEQQAEIATVSIPSRVAAEAGTTSFSDVAATLTEAGVPAFGDFYQAGDALDPITLSFDLDCVGAAGSDSDADKADAADSANDTGAEIMPISANMGESSFPWLPVGIGAAVVVAAGAVIGLTLAKRRKNTPSDTPE